MCTFKLIVSYRESGNDEIEEFVASAPECPIVGDLLQWTEGVDTREAMVSESDCGTVRPTQVLPVTPSEEEPTIIVRANR